MVKKCCVFKCPSESYGGCNISFHGFPKNEELRQAWLSNIYVRQRITKNSVVCSRHFQPSCFYSSDSRIHLKRDAIPTIPPVTREHYTLISEGNVLVEHSYFKKKDVNNILEPTYFKDTEETVVPEPEKYSWQKNEAVSITDPIDTEEFSDENSLYNDDRTPTPILEVDVDDSPLHVGFQCNACNGEIKGFRYTCVQCEDFDLCSACELNGAHAQHYMLRVPKPKPYMETQIVLERIRRHLMKKLDPIEGDQEPEDDPSLKLEIKSEVDEEEELGKDMEIEDIGEATTSDQDESIILRAVENTPDTSIREPEERNINDSTSRQMDTVPSTAKRKIIVPHTDIQLQDDPPAKRNLVPVKRIEFRQNVTRKVVYLENCVLLKPGTSLNSKFINPRSEKCRK